MDEDVILESGFLPFFRHPMSMILLYTVFYCAVFAVGLLGNIFVVLAVVSHTQLRTTTDYLISSLAAADLLIILFCVPATLLNNIVTEWQLGAFMCKVSTWVNATTSCASIYTLVAVTADRYLAICHTLKYTQWDSKYTLYGIAAIWIVSGALAAPQLYYYDEVLVGVQLDENITVTLALCTSRIDERLLFVCINLILAFLVPFLLISVSYTRIFITVSNHRSLAVDAHVRDERVKLRVAHMMLTVIVVFALCWVPLYSVYCYFFFFADGESNLFIFASTILRPLFQWLSVLSSSLNPLIYIAYSQKYRRAFHRLLLLPCRSRYERVRSLTRNTLRMGTEHSMDSSPSCKKSMLLVQGTKCTDVSPRPSVLDSFVSPTVISSDDDHPMRTFDIHSSQCGDNIRQYE